MAAGERDAIRTPRPCVSYAPGHTVHHIQWRLASRDPATKVPGRVVEITDAIVVEVDGELRRFHNHELDRARELLAVMGPDVGVQTRWGLLWFDHYLVCITEEGPLGPCPTEGLPDHGFIARAEPSGHDRQEQLDGMFRSLMAQRDTARRGREGPA